MISFGILDQQYQIFNAPIYLTFEPEYEHGSIIDNQFVTTVTKLNQINCTDVNYETYEKYGYGNIFFSNSLQDYYCYKNII